LLLAGDAASYVEPFTGEGMASAIEGAIAVVPLVQEGVRQWCPEIAERWQHEYDRRIRSRQLACRAISWLVRHPRMLRWSLSGVAAQPRIGITIGNWIGGSSTHKESVAL
jgi:2-polyprenyl-6-methoxyphenol hydroxylase-like FAD-dependent oxidoreductase